MTCKLFNAKLIPAVDWASSNDLSMILMSGSRQQNEPSARVKEHHPINQLYHITHTYPHLHGRRSCETWKQQTSLERLSVYRSMSTMFCYVRPYRNACKLYDVYRSSAMPLMCLVLGGMNPFSFPPPQPLDTSPFAPRAISGPILLCARCYTSVMFAILDGLLKSRTRDMYTGSTSK